MVTALEQGGTPAARVSDESVSSKQALELVAPDLRAHVCHQVGHELYVVQREEPVDGRLLCAPQVVQIGAGVVHADEAIARSVERAVVVAVARLAHLEAAVARERGAVPPEPRRPAAVESVNPEPHPHLDRLDVADAEQVVWALARQKRHHVPQQRSQLAPVATQRAPHAEAVEGPPRQCRH